MGGKIILSCGHEDLVWPNGWPVYTVESTREGRLCVAYSQWCSKCLSNQLKLAPDKIFPHEYDAQEYIDNNG
jgi:hypothetical protein